MQFIQHDLSGIIEYIPTKFHDDRGHFYESYNQTRFAANGITENFVQDNYSFSTAGVIRGLHFQKEPHGQGKLVRCMTGKVMDVVVDLRKSSPTFGQHGTYILDAEIGNMLYVPVGFAHGFVALTDAIFVYKCTDFWNKEAESGIRWNDPTLNISWGVENPVVSDKDQILPLFDPNETIFK
ncbi:dTDP-4-dehydrorhamnose 3,5-epimerase [Aquirufa regiilacus]|jgi:dTDP-4-dehydrorhamnose 3,5-epimerase|uniref:dTDP-4-dehydrorhamnose 3,5-epimerase n=1 Tax=Aquirufa regiilacus TaxID=3024868 RepID=A0ABU3TQ48_9BACT|nr:MULTISPECIES: dTDP-4-dehydrorhamnose 3,5-epimerase [unclassified Aquirufa]MBP6055056.1 dTDP-4-dehydrorhamnose 3,5-epimerase [Cytophagaceae bacterium]MBP6094138.1 dTDP-4-dehydrorhamnose 3,5-epimerase [Cytophagaceae bacterium]MDT8887373.1 dTDP-4-dehydrorhamnose 3,5-epimerase [Aquirufa sp. LEPPI-3A]MDU0807954.1 dTDP-4-dehydrorhamnose 3,5-epimerase [Aquirufa sp. LEOWEIH-7C]